MAEPDNNTLNLEDLTPSKPVGEPAKARQSQAAAEANAAVSASASTNTNVLATEPTSSSGAVEASSPTLSMTDMGVAADAHLHLPAMDHSQPVMPVSTDAPKATDPIHIPAVAAVTQAKTATTASATPTPEPEPLLNLSPVTASNEGTASIFTETYSWLGDLAQRLRLRKWINRHTLSYLLIGLVSIGIFLLVFNFPVIQANLHYRFSKPKATPSATAEPTAQTTAVAPGSVVIVPKISVNAPIQFPPTLDESQIQLSLRDGVAHYAGTALPGQQGNVVLFGHSSNDWWEPGNYKFVFALLDRLAAGDTVQINYESRKYVYQVTNSVVVAPTDFSVIQATPEPTLTLITCTPPGTSWKRLVVHAKQIEPAATKTQPKAAQVSPQQLSNLPGDAPQSVWTKITNYFQKLF